MTIFYIAKNKFHTNMLKNARYGNNYQLISG